MELYFGVILQKGHSATEEIVEIGQGQDNKSTCFQSIGNDGCTISIYISSLMTYIESNREYLIFKFSIHEINTRKKLLLQRPIANLT
jgi:hypothetical protein